MFKESSTTTKIRAVFDTSVKTTTGISLNDTLLVGPTVHSSLIDVLLRFCLHRVAMTADISKMYHSIALTQSDKDLHRFMWRCSPQDPFKDYRMTRVTFGVSASSFIANMYVKQNVIDFAMEYTLAANAVEEAFTLMTVSLEHPPLKKEYTFTFKELQSFFSKAGFHLRKWNSSEPSVLEQIGPSLRDFRLVLTMSSSEADYPKTLGITFMTSFS